MTKKKKKLQSNHKTKPKPKKQTNKIKEKKKERTQVPRPYSVSMTFIWVWSLLDAFWIATVAEWAPLTQVIISELHLHMLCLHTDKNQLRLCYLSVSLFLILSLSEFKSMKYLFS